LTTIKLTSKELEAILYAIDTTEATFAGWSADEKGTDTIQTLKALARIESKIYNNEGKTK